MDYPLLNIPHDDLQLPVVELPQDVQDSDANTDTEMLEGQQVCFIPFCSLIPLICT
jgi:hypothetical protein